MSADPQAVGGNESGLDLRSLPLEDPLLLARLREMAEDWRYSDEFIGKVVRAQARNVLAAIPDGWAKIDGEWVQITSDGVGYGEFDRAHPGRRPEDG